MLQFYAKTNKCHAKHKVQANTIQEGYATNQLAKPLF